MRMFSIKRSFVLVCTVGCILLISDLTGLHRHFFEKDFTQFSYPLDINDFKNFIHRYRAHEPVSQEPINEAAANLIYLSKADQGCISENYRLIILVKSKPRNFQRRETIRKTWGFAKRFSDVQIKTVFLLGFEKDLDNQHDGQEQDDTLQIDEAIEKEISTFGDIIQGDFHDHDYNTTIKTFMGLRWLVETCSQFRFALFVADDMYVSVKNVLKFIRHPVEYPIYWEKQKELDNKRYHRNFYHRVSRSINDNGHPHRLLNNLASDGVQIKDSNKETTQENKLLNKKPTKVWKNSNVDFDIDLSEDVILYAGNVVHGSTHRSKMGTKYFLTLEEYPFDKLPPFVSTEAIVLSKSAVIELYYASFYTKYLHMDDLFLGLCAKKMEIEPFHSEYFTLDPSFVHDPYDKEKNFRYVITGNNFDDLEGLSNFWNKQKALGNA